MIVDRLGSLRSMASVDGEEGIILILLLLNRLVEDSKMSIASEERRKLGTQVLHDFTDSFPFKTMSE